MSCACDDVCNAKYHGHVCQLDPDHDGQHSCHGRIFRTGWRRGDIVWTDDDTLPPPSPSARHHYEELRQTCFRGSLCDCGCSGHPRPKFCACGNPWPCPDAEEAS